MNLFCIIDRNNLLNTNTMDEFGYNTVSNSTNVETDEGKGEVNNNGLETVPNDDDKTNLDENNISNKNNTDDTNDANKTVVENNNAQENNDDNKFVLEPGTVLDIDDKKYTVDDKGNIIDDKGNIFKEAKDIKEFIDSFNVEDSNNEDEISIDSIKNAFEIDIVDENNTPVEFENSPAGIKSYLDAVIETRENEIAENAINQLYEKVPVLKDIVPYYIANGNSLDGFFEIKDRSNIVIDDNNEAQQEEIIKMSWSEQGRKGDVDNYINYLKSTGALAEVAKEELEALKEKDEQTRKAIAEQAEKAERDAIEKEEKYWKGVKDVIDSRSIAGYKIPDTIIINKNGKKVSATPNDFFNYIYQVDKEGKSRYQYDLANETLEARRDDAILRAYLKFVGGSYSNLVDMAINDKEVKKLKLLAKTRNTAGVKITKPNSGNKNGKIDFGY